MCCEIRGGQLLGKCTAACFKEILTCDETAWRVTSHSIYLYFAWFKICIQPKIWPCMYNSVKIVLCEKNWSHSNSSFFSNVAWVWPRGDFFLQIDTFGRFSCSSAFFAAVSWVRAQLLGVLLEARSRRAHLVAAFPLASSTFPSTCNIFDFFSFFDATFSFKRLYGLGYSFRIFGTAK